MRDIKFRAWTDQGTEGNFRMTYAVGILPSDSKTEWQENGFGLFLKPDTRHILMQFTGVQDKNGREIYEGDICVFSKDALVPPPLVVGFTSGVFILGSEDKPIALANCRPPEFEIEVIGNVYENANFIARQ